MDAASGSVRRDTVDSNKSEQVSDEKHIVYLEIDVTVDTTDPKVAKELAVQFCSVVSFSPLVRVDDVRALFTERDRRSRKYGS